MPRYSPRSATEQPPVLFAIAWYDPTVRCGVDDTLRGVALAVRHCLNSYVALVACQLKSNGTIPNFPHIYRYRGVEQLETFTTILEN